MKTIEQDGIPFWGGPAHGNLRVPLGTTFYVPVLNSLNYLKLEDEATSVSVPYLIVEYHMERFMWLWKENWYIGKAMVSSDSSVLEVEDLLDFLGGLFGGKCTKTGV